MHSLTSYQRQSGFMFKYDYLLYFWILYTHYYTMSWALLLKHKLQNINKETMIQHHVLHWAWGFFLCSHVIKTRTSSDASWSFISTSSSLCGGWMLMHPIPGKVVSVLNCWNLALIVFDGISGWVCFFSKYPAYLSGLNQQIFFVWAESIYDFRQLWSFWRLTAI